MKFNQVNLANADVYPDGRLTELQILDFISNHGEEVITLNDHLSYWKGENVEIYDRLTEEPYADNEVNNIVPVPHGRSLAQSIIGYMGKPGLITYGSPDAQIMQSLTDIYTNNNEPVKTSYVIRDMTTYGYACEIHYVQKTTLNRAADVGDDADIDMSVSSSAAKFAVVPPQEVIPLYNFDIEPSLSCVIRYYNRTENKETTTYIQVYYADRVDYFHIGTSKMFLDASVKHFYQKVPFVVYWNNDQAEPDYLPVKPLIEAYDKLLSGSVNEFEKFAQAYLILVNFMLDAEDKAALKAKSIFQNVPDKDAVSFLTKDINTDFISYMGKELSELIYKHAHIYDITNVNLSGDQTGIAIKYKLFDMENCVAATKEAYLKEGLKRRHALIGTVENFKTQTLTNDGVYDDIMIDCKRNVIEVLKETIENVNAAAGILPLRTRLSWFSSDIVENVDETIKELEEEKQRNMDAYQQGVFGNSIEDGRKDNDEEETEDA